MKILLVKKDELVQTQDYEIFYDGQKLNLSCQNNKRNICISSGEAYTYSGKNDFPSAKNGMERGNLILFALGIPTNTWMPTEAKFEEVRQKIIDSHEVKISETYCHSFYSYMTKRDGSGKEVLLMAWVSNEISTIQQLNEIIKDLAPFGTDSSGFLVLV